MSGLFCWHYLVTKGERLQDTVRFPQFIAPENPVNAIIRRCPTSRKAAEDRILIWKLGAHGDVLMASPLLRALRDAHPAAHITWAIEQSERAAMDANPFVDELLLWNSGFWNSMPKRVDYGRWLVRAARMGYLLRQRRFNLFISLQAEKWPLVAIGVHAKNAIGVSKPQILGPGHKYDKYFDVFYTGNEQPPHRTDQYLLPLEPLEIKGPHDKRMTLGFTNADERASHEYLVEQGVALSEKYVVIAPMTTWPTRCWPAERYAALAERMLEEGLTRHIVLIGSEKEREDVKAVADLMTRKPVVAAGVMPFRAMGALIAHARLLVSGDTGPMHVAAAVETPFVALFGPTPVPGRAPLAGRGIPLMHPVPCGPCDKMHCVNIAPETQMLCMKLITVEEALIASRKSLDGIQNKLGQG